MIRSMLANRLACVLLCVLVCLGAVPACASGPQPAAEGRYRAGLEKQPQSSLFSDLPLYHPGDEVTAGDYTVRLKEARIDPSAGTLALDLSVTNGSDQEVDMGWAFQLRDGQGGLVKPAGQGQALTVEQSGDLPAGQSLTGTWRYPLPDAATGGEDTGGSAIGGEDTRGAAAGGGDADYSGYRLLFAPRGWSGPVVVFAVVP